MNDPEDIDPKEYVMSLPALRSKKIHLLIEAQLPPALAQWLVNQGHQAAHVFDVGLQAAEDGPIWEYARKEEAVIVSKDEDFVDRWLLSDTPVPLVWKFVAQGCNFSACQCRSDIRCARYYAGGDGAARHPYHAKQIRSVRII